MTISEQLRELLAKATPGDWQSRDEVSAEGFVTIIANIDGEILDGSPSYTYDTVAICENEFGERLPNVAANVRLIVFLRNNAPHFATLEEENVRLREALVQHNDRLRSAQAIASRDGADTNWKAFRGQVTYTLAEYHDLVNAAHAALQEQPR